MKYPLLRGALGAASVTLFVAAVALAAPPVYAAEPMEKDTGATQKSKGTMADDTMITTKVKAAFVKDETVHALKIKVTTNNGIVQLSGFAGSAQEAGRSPAPYVRCCTDGMFAMSAQCGTAQSRHCFRRKYQLS